MSSPAAGPARPVERLAAIYCQITEVADGWQPFGVAAGGPMRPGGDGAAGHARHVRIAAAAYEVPMLAAEWRETSGAAVRAALACPHDAVATRGHTLATADFIDTLVVEAAVHYLDLTMPMPVAPAADPASLALVRDVTTCQSLKRRTPHSGPPPGCCRCLAN